MGWSSSRAASGCVAVVGLVAACSDPKDKPPSPAPGASVVVAAPVATETEINPRLLRRFQPIGDTVPGNEPLTAARVSLGRRLFFETRLSQDGDMSCNTCHEVGAYGTDGKPISTGHKGQLGQRNAPTVYNAAGYFAQFWDGRARTVEEQAKGPLLNPVEMGMRDEPHVIAVLAAVPEYRSAFKLAFPEDAAPLTLDNVARALGAFERKLTTPGRWDKYLQGDKTALTSGEKEGLRTFLNVGCMVCHTGAYLGGSMFERAGVVEPWPNQKDRGRAAVTGSESDAMMFKVPTLRNVAKTAPYFHDGSVATLPEAVRMMGKHQLGLELSEQETTAIVTWLGSLTGERPAALIAKPGPWGADNAPDMATATAPVATCGGGALPECPLQGWMKANAGHAMTAGDLTRLERVFTRIRELAPDGYAGWDGAARDGLAAAKAKDLEGCRKACKACHEQLRPRYRAERRDAPLR
jgi:cytochrome c peroxidase